MPPTPTPKPEAQSGRDDRDDRNPAGRPAPGLRFPRQQTTDEENPFDKVEWVPRAVRIDATDGSSVFEQEDVESPVFWSQQATNIVASKYFRGKPGTAQRETSIRGLIARVVNKIDEWGNGDRYFTDPGSREAFKHELKHLILHQMATFNSPVWFNLGYSQRAQASACLPYEARVNTTAGLVMIGELHRRARMMGIDSLPQVFDKDGVPSRIIKTACNGRRRLHNMKMADGTSMLVTGDHRVFTEVDGKPVEKPAREINPGDKLVLPRAVLNTEGAERALDHAPDDGWLAGLMVSNAYSGRPSSTTSDTWEIKTADDASAHKIQELLTQRGLSSNVTVHKKYSQVRGCSASGREYWSALDVWNRTGKKKTPQWVLRGDAEVWRSYLRGLVDGDGYVAPKPNGSVTVHLSNTSLDVVQNAQILLRSLGILASVTISHKADVERRNGHERKTWYNLGIQDGVSVDRYADQIGFKVAHKSKRLESREEYKPYRRPSIGVTEIDRRASMSYVYDIQTECSTFWTDGVLVHNCFIISVEDSMESILDLAKTEGMLFKYGSGTGSNLSPLRSEGEGLTVGGTASGPVSFMKGFDAFAGVIKSGGASRRAAKLVALNVDHPDIIKFIDCKVEEERKAWALIDAGYDASITGTAYSSIFFQNSNNSVRVPDEFMQAVAEDGEWQTRAVTGEQKVIGTYRARDILRRMAVAAHQCGDPGIQFDTTVNNWHTCPETGRINASNPCFAGDTLVLTTDGPLPIAALAAGYSRGERLPEAIVTDLETCTRVHRKIKRAWLTRSAAKLVKVETARHIKVLCTPDHRFYMTDGTAVEAEDLAAEIENGRNLLVTDKGGRATDRPSIDTVKAVTPVWTEGTDVFDLEVENIHRFTVTSGDCNHGIVVSNCSEYMFLDDSSCNLASINLMKFARPGTRPDFDVKSFRAAVRTMITAQEIIVGNAQYPTEKITRNSYAYRPLGLGYANLGAMLMSFGIPYDSEAGRGWAAAVTALMTGEAYAQSARIARDCGGPFSGYERNREPFLTVMKSHRAKVTDARGADTPPEAGAVFDAAEESWEKAIEIGTEHGFRNAQTTVLAPTGTISFMLGCDTTGVEPDIALVKYKQMVDGGTMRMVNTTVRNALERLGYSEEKITPILAHVEKNGTIEGAPWIEERHLPIFDCAFKPANGKRSISPEGHLKMIGATQPFISGAISKTINLPEEATVEDIEHAYIDAWKLGTKSVSVYRNNSKRSQPLNTSGEKPKNGPGNTAAAGAPPEPSRRKLPDERKAINHKFVIAGHKGYITVGMYDDGSPGELFLVIAKEGSTISGFADAFAQAISYALQYGVPLKTLTKKFSHQRFEPAGITGNREVRMAKSIVDYVFRWLATKFLSAEEQIELGVNTDRNEPETPTSASASPTLTGSDRNPNAKPETGESPTATFQNDEDAPPCATCGAIMIRAGACYSCANCGATSGCG